MALPPARLTATSCQRYLSDVQSYFLARHVYSCVTDDHVVLLDLQRDKYVGVGREQMATLATRVKGWPLSGAPPSGESPGGDVRTSNDAVASSGEAVVGKMLAAGMLT